MEGAEAVDDMEGGIEKGDDPPKPKPGIPMLNGFHATTPEEVPGFGGGGKNAGRADTPTPDPAAAPYGGPEMYGGGAPPA